MEHFGMYLGLLGLVGGIAISLMFYLTTGVRNTWIGAFVALYGLANLIGAMLDAPRRPARSTTDTLQPRNPE
jgi:hypothetical protein